MKQHVLRRLGALVLTLALALSLTATPAWAAGAPTSAMPAITISAPANAPVDAGRLLLTVGDTDLPSVVLTADVVNGDDCEVVWSSEDGTVATVEKGRTDDRLGRVRAVGGGSTRITATLKRTDGAPFLNASGTPIPNPSASFNVTVYVPTIKLHYKNDDTPLTQISLATGKTATLAATVLRAGEVVDGDVTLTIRNATDSDVIRQTANANGEITVEALKSGTAYVTATSRKYGISSECAVVVPDPRDVSSLTLTPTSLTMTVGDIRQLQLTVQPSNARDKTVTWSWPGKDTPGEIVSVNDEGYVTARRVGTTTITVTSVANPTVSARCEVTVVERLSGLAIRNLTGSQFNLSANVTKPGDTQIIEAITTPSNAITTTGTIKWESDNRNVITVATDARDPKGLTGILTLVGPGEATITVSSGDVKGTCKITVPGVVLQSGVLTMTNGRLSMKEGQTETLTYQAYGRAATEIGTTAPVWFSSDSSIVDVDRNTGKLTARKPGTVTITLTLGNHEATCTVTVAEDTSTLITVTERVSAGVPMSLYSARTSGGTIYSELNRIASEKLGGALSYINNISVATEQGIVYNNHRSEADTGAGVGIMEQYKPSGTGPDTLSALSFVPRSTYSGTAEITFTGWGNGRSFNGTIRITVAGLGDGGDVSYSTNGDPVTFLSDDFNIVSNSKAGHNLKYITFTPPASSAGTLYYNYTSESHPGEKVVATTQYRRSGTPSLDKVTFVPAKGYSGTVSINYRAVDSSDVAYTGTVTIRVTAQYDPAGPGDIYYSTGYGSWATFRAVDFSNASLRATGEALSYVRFRQPPSSEGTLFYNYSGFASNGGVISPETSYHSSGTPLLSSVSFVPTTTSPSQVEVPYTGYSIRGTAFTGTVHVTVVGKPVQPNESGTWYTTIVGRSLELKGSDFYRACQEATGKTLYYVQFTSLPSVGTGALRYTSQSGASSSTVSTDTWCYYDRPNAGVMLDNVYFQPGSNFTGTVRIPYRGYCTDRTAFDGEVVIRVAAAASPAGSSYFNDMRNYSWAVSAVDYLYEKGVVNGVGNGGFGPGQRVLRRDFVVMLCRAFNFYSYSTYSFPDVPTNAYYSQSIAAAKELGVISGSGGNFMPNGQLTRQDAMVMIKNALDAAGWRVGTASTSVLNRFPDRGSVAAYAQDAVSTLVQLGAVSGDGNGRLNPRSTITRAEVAVILHYIMTM